MNPSILKSATATSLLLGAAFTYGADTTSATSAAAKPQAPSAGLMNDWLREQSSALTSWDIGGQFRARYENFEGGSPAFPNNDFQAHGAFNDNSFTFFRAKAHVGYKSDWFGAYVEGRHSSAWDDNDPRDPGQDRLDLHQAFVTLGNAKEFPITAKIGRQEMFYGDERLIGASDWTNPQRVFDAAKLRFGNDNTWVDAFVSRVVVIDDTEFNQPDDYDFFSGLYASSKTLIPIQESQLYFLSRNSEPKASVSPRDILTIGARVKSLPGKLPGALQPCDYTAEVVGQLGSITQGGERRDQRAFASSVGGGYTWKDTWATPRAGFEYNFSTGDSDPTDHTSETLDNLFPTNHKHYGYMDFVGWRNIHNPRLSLSAKPHKSLAVSLDFHLFWLADTADSFYPQGGSGRSSNGYGKHPGYDSFVGSEIDLDATWTPVSWGAVRAGYGHFFTGDYIDQSKASVGGSMDADWFYLQTTVNF